MLFLCTLNLTSCNNEDEEGTQITDYKEYLLTVASQQIPGVGWSDGFNYLTDVYAVKKEQSAEWESLSSIKGFEFEEGYEYEIRISETSYLDHRMSQPAWTEYQLLEILSKEKKDSEAETPEKKEEEQNPEQDKFIRLLYNKMLDNEMDEKYVNSILEDASKTKKADLPFDYLLANIYQKMVLKFGKSEGITPSADGPRIVLFIGPTGVGKTTTIAKLAGKYCVEDKKKVALLTADTYRIAAAEQLRTYANILETPFRVIYTPEELQTAVKDYWDCDYIFIDTAGRSHQNADQLEKMKEMVGALKDPGNYHVFLVLSATTKYRDLQRIADCYGKIADYELIFTKLDETEAVGNLLNMKLYTGAPVAYVTCGQNVPDDMEVFNPQKTVKQILGGKE